MKVLYYDCFSGISGDMHLGALVDLGVELEYLQKELAKLPLEGEYELSATTVSKSGIRATQVKVKLREHHHHDHHHDHRTFGNIRAMILSSALPLNTKERALKMFQKIAEAESRIHAKPLEQVAFHEVGAIDSIIDIVGAAIGLEALGVEKIYASRIELGGGFVRCAHGLLPVPAPATLEILQGLPIGLHGVPFEATTPTGAAILACNVDSFSGLLPLSPQKIGYGAGEREGVDIPNILRLILADEPAQPSPKEVLLETNIDDMSPEHLAYAVERLFEAGALDVYMTPITAKKSRLATKLSILSSLDKERELTQILFQETSSIGLRRLEVEKIALARRFIQVPTPWGEVSVKLSMQGEKVVRYKAEYEECRRLAMTHSVPLHTLYLAIDKAVESCLNDTKH
ncbi:MAG: nickel pincer cofactor biosynthesis protein LarC [Wolinella sp.]